MKIKRKRANVSTSGINDAVQRKEIKTPFDLVNKQLTKHKVCFSALNFLYTQFVILNIYL